MLLLCLRSARPGGFVGVKRCSFYGDVWAIIWIMLMERHKRVFEEHIGMDVG